MKVLKFINSGIKIIIVLILLLSYTKVLAQDNNSNLVFIKDNNLRDLLEIIITNENTCSSYSKTINWYVDFKHDNTILVSQSRIANLLESLKNNKREILTTIINDKIVFLVTKNDKNLFYKSEFSINLEEFKNNEIVLFEDFSAWKIKSNEKRYEVVNKIIFKCN